MKIKFKNGSYLEPIKSTDIKRSDRADKLKEFYLKYPDVFLENYFDIELLEYQKLFIRLIVGVTDRGKWKYGTYSDMLTVREWNKLHRFIGE